MRRINFIGLAVVIAAAIFHAPALRAEGAESPSAVAIRSVLDDQAAAWNRGDVDAFMRAYKDSPDTTFIGKSIAQGYTPILERYKKAYSSKDAMGKLEFSDVAVRGLDANYAVVTGRFHLARNAAGGGDVSGIYSLVWEKTSAGWKIILDHSSVTTP
jgi:uncharacterized protein (TIGR02246 family)